MSKKWMEGHIEDKLSGHISQHQFKIVRRGEKAVTFYKKWSTSPEWLPKCSDGAINESNELFLVHSLPSGIPDHIEPSTDKINVKKLKSAVSKILNSMYGQRIVNNIRWPIYAMHNNIYIDHFKVSQCATAVCNAL